MPVSSANDTAENEQIDEDQEEKELTATVDDDVNDQGVYIKDFSKYKINVKKHVFFKIIFNLILFFFII